MPTGIHFSMTPGGQLVTGITIPYPSATATGLVDFTQFWLGSLQMTPGNLAERTWNSGSGITPHVKPGYTGAFVTLYNDSDSFLQIQWTNTSIQDFCPPHHQRPAPIPINESSFTWSINYQNSVAAPGCQQILSCIFVDQVALASGHVIREGPINPPIVTAASLPPGTLPAGVLVPAANVQPGTYPTGIFQWDAGLASISSGGNIDGQTLQSEVAINVGPIVSGQYGLIETVTASQIGLLLSCVLAGSANYMRFRTWDGSASHPVFGIGHQARVNGVSTTLGDAGGFEVVAQQNTAGSLGVSPIVATTVAAGVHVTTNVTVTILTFTPSAAGFFRVCGGFSNINATTGTQMSANYTDPNTAGAVTLNFQTALGQVVLNGTPAFPAGTSQSTYTMTFMASAAAITITFLDTHSPASDFVYATIERLI